MMNSLVMVWAGVMMAGVALSAVCAAQGVSGADAREEGRDITISLKVPDSMWTVAIERVYDNGDALIAVSRVSRPDGFGAQVISTVSDSVTIPASALPIRHVVFGKTWGWRTREPIAFLDDEAELNEFLNKNARLLFDARKDGGAAAAP